MDAIKTIGKAMLLGAFLLGFFGGVVGAIAALFIWPSSNLGPPVGAIEGFLVGAPIGILFGLIYGVSRVCGFRRKAGSEDLKSDNSEL